MFRRQFYVEITDPAVHCSFINQVVNGPQFGGPLFSVVEMKNFNSIRHNSDFKKVYKNGRRKTFGPVTMYICENGLDNNRLGVSISKKKGNSVERHTFTRRLREIFRKVAAQSGYDIIIVARERADATDYAILENAYSELLKKHNIFKNSLS